MDNNDSKPRRIIVSPERLQRKELKVSQFNISPESVLNDAMQTIALEMTRYRAKVGSGKPLDPKEAKIVTNYVKSMTEVLREQREQDRHSQLDKLSTEELAVLAKKVLENGSSVVDAARITEERLAATQQTSEDEDDE